MEASGGVTWRTSKKAAVSEGSRKEVSEGIGNLDDFGTTSVQDFLYIVIYIISEIISI